MLVHQFAVMALFVHLTLSVGLTAFALTRSAVGSASPRLPLLASLPLPLVAIGMSILLFVDAVTATPEECGVDACGMAMMAAMLLAVMSLLAYAVGAIAAMATRRLMGRSKG